MRPTVSYGTDRDLLHPPNNAVLYFMMVGRADVAEYMTLGRSRHPVRMERAIMHLTDNPMRDSPQAQISGAVYIDLDFRTLQEITAYTNAWETDPIDQY